MREKIIIGKKISAPLQSAEADIEHNYLFNKTPYEIV